MGAPYIYDVSRLRVKGDIPVVFIYTSRYGLKVSQNNSVFL